MTIRHEKVQEAIGATYGIDYVTTGHRHDYRAVMYPENNLQTAMTVCDKLPVGWAFKRFGTTKDGNVFMGIDIER